MGNPAIETELELAGVRNHFGIGRDDELADVANPQDVEQTVKIKLEGDVAAVLVGFDGHFNHTKLVKAASYLRDPQCRFSAPTPTRGLHYVDHPHVIIGERCLLAAVETASLRKAEVVLGSPAGSCSSASANSRG